MEDKKLLNILNQIIYPGVFQNKKSKKETLANKLELKLSKKGKKFIDKNLFSKGNLPFDGPNSEYTNLQRYSEGKEKIPYEEFPSELKNISNVLKNIGRPNPLKVENINKEIKDHPINWFLNEMQKPSERYFKEGNSFHSVVQYLTIKYCDSLSKDSLDEGNDIILAMKEGAIQDLENSFIHRGPNLKNQDDVKNEVSKIITPKRYEYLLNLSKEFYENPKSDKIINFVNSLPDNAWFDDQISLMCDEFGEFEPYNKKYNPNYKTLDEHIKERDNNEHSNVQDDLPF